MGLDMYLEKQTYVSHFDGANKNLKITGLEGKKVNCEKVSGIIEDAGYWRKANQIHRWFVDNVQNGVDDCKSYLVEDSQLEALLKTVKTVLNDHSQAPDLLTVQDGFFFGGTKYDEYYFKCLEDTVEILEESLKDCDDKDYYYRSWW